MNLIKWIRRNERKAMAIAVIIISLGFVAGPSLRWLGQKRTGRYKTVAYFADNSEITNYDLALARRELETLKLMQADNILRNIAAPIFQMRDLQAVLLAELLFHDRSISPMISEQIKQKIEASPYRISNKQINDIYRLSMPTEIYWLLLKNEAQLAGVRISNEMSRKLLETTIPQLFNGAKYSQLIRSVINRQSLSEKEILTTFSNLVMVSRYANMICTNESLTRAQIMRDVSWEEETINVEFVKFDSAVFAETGVEPTEEEIIEHFEKYKKFFAGDINDQNPYGFGYKLHDRVQLEYIIVKLDDVSKIVTKPTQEEAEEFYEKHREEFTASVPVDPNDPNSPVTERIKSYSEVASTISKSLLNNKTASKAESILQEAKTLTEAGLQDMDIDSAEITSEKFRQMAVDYSAVAKRLSEKHKTNIYSGRTELLNALDIITDKHLGTLFIKGYGYNPVALARVIFAVDELKASELGPFDAPKPRLYENIGPAKDMFGQIMAIVRITEAKKASEPESINQTLISNSLEFDEEQQTNEEIYSVKDKVAEDLKKLLAMNTTKSKAEEFTNLAVKKNWESAVDKFNELYAKHNKQIEEKNNVFKLQNLTDLRRTTDTRLRTLALKNKGNPIRWWLVNGAKVDGQLIERFYSFVPQDSNTPDTLPLILEFKPDMSHYCLKNISVKRLDEEQYDKIKATLVYREDFLQSQSVAPVYFNPENILKRMNFRLAKEDKTPADVNTPAEAQGGS